jgi:hypothetical protein
MAEKIDSKNIVYEKLLPLITKSFLLTKGDKLIYELFLNTNLELYQNISDAPKRGYSAFETDLIIYEKGQKNIPRVVIECKKNLSSHDIITYNAKAGLHKDIYPWLRYGVIDIGINKVPMKFYTHNANIDFFIAAKELFETAEILIIDKTIKEELSLSKKKEEIYYSERNYKVFRTDIIVS